MHRRFVVGYLRWVAILVGFAYLESQGISMAVSWKKKALESQSPGFHEFPLQSSRIQHRTGEQISVLLLP
jgi:hypothetical protein